jgi:hypothetical protein
MRGTGHRPALILRLREKGFLCLLTQWQGPPGWTYARRRATEKDMPFLILPSPPVGEGRVRGTGR